MNGHTKNGNDVTPLHPTPTLAKEWRRAREEGFEITLPSGNTAVLKPVALDQLLAKGTIPDFLTSVASKSLWTETDSEEVGEDPKMGTDLIALINLIVPLAMMRPQIVDEPQDGKEEIALTDLDFMDKVAIFNLSIQSATVLRTFRDNQTKGMADLSDSENMSHETELSTGN